jgi:hypothetical protein
MPKKPSAAALTVRPSNSQAALDFLMKIYATHRIKQFESLQIESIRRLSVENSLS